MKTLIASSPPSRRSPPPLRPPTCRVALPRRRSSPRFRSSPGRASYAGFNAGYGFDASSNSAPTVVGVPAAAGIFAGPAGGNVPGVLAFSNSRNNEGFVGGGQIGYNYQFTPGSGVVVGLEADAQYVDFGAQRNRFAFATVNGGGIIPGTLVYNPNGLSGLDYFGTVRGRLGYAFDRTLCTPPAASPTAPAAAVSSARACPRTTSRPATLSAAASSTLSRPTPS